MLTNDTKDKIVRQSGDLFLQYGMRSVTMDDVAREVSMSKKTLYQYFDNKDELVSEVTKDHIKQEIAEFEQIRKEAENAVHEIILVSKCMRKHVLKMNPSLLHDMQKYHTNSWDLYLKFKHEKLRGFIKANLENGIAEGLFRSSIDSEIISILRVEQVQLAFNNKIYAREKFDFREVQLQILDHFIHGILTNKGRSNYQQYSELESNQSTLTI